MAKIKVGTGFGKVPFAAALRRATSGDLLILDPGRYDLEHLSLYGVGLHGNGTPDQVVLTGAFEVNGHCTFTNLTIHAMPYKNAIFVAGAADRATVTSCVVVAEPSGKYPAMWCGEGSLVVHQVLARCDAESFAVNIAENGLLHATASQLDRVSIHAAKAELIDSTTSFLAVSGGARVATHGAHRCNPLPDKRIFVVSGQSVCTFTQLVLGGGEEEGLAEDSIIQLHSVVQDAGGALTVITADGARVTTSADGVTVVDRDAPVAPPAGPKSLRWLPEHAQLFSTAVEPLLSAGDTVLLDEGDYVLDLAEGVSLAVNFEGQGAERTRLHGTITPAASVPIVLKNLTLIAPDIARNAVNAYVEDARLTLEGVTIQGMPNAERSPIYASAGIVSMRKCAVVASADDATISGALSVVGEAVLEASDSQLGWLYVDEGGRATLSDCSSYCLNARAGASITVVDRHQLMENACDQYEVLVGTDASIQIPLLTAGSSEPYLRLEGGDIALAEFGITGSETFTVHRVEGTLRGIEASAYTLCEPDDSGDLVQVRVATRGESAQQGHGLADTVVSGAEGPQAPLGEPAVDSPPTSETSAADNTDPLAELNALVGLHTVKKQVKGFVTMVKLRQKRVELGLPADDDLTLHSMFLGNPGTGKTTVARLVGRAMHQAGVVAKDTFIEAGRAQLISEHIGGTAKQTRALLERGIGGVIFIDEAYALASEDSAGFAEEAVTEILTFLENHRADTMVIFAGYTDKMHDLLSVNEGLKSRVTHRFDFEDYSPGEIAEIGLSELARGQYRVNEGLYQRLIGTAYSQSADRSNARWVRNFNQRLRTVQGQRVIELADPSRDDLVSILDVDLHALSGGGAEDRGSKLDQKLAELDALTGLAPVKAWVRSLVEQATINQRMIELDGSTDRPNYHVAFTGNPGTGKTTVARIIAEIFHSLGILAAPTVKSVAASQLIGQYLGHSAANTHKAFDAAMGGVLFVDEAHQLRSEGGPNSALQQEVVNAMITRLEDDRDKFVAVFAGYTRQMHEFFATDPGLRSRIPAEIEFPDYTPAEVAEIAAATLSAKWTFNRDLFVDVVTAAYAALPAEERSNGRWARTVTEAVIARHNRYLVKHDVHGEAMRTIPDAVLQEFMPS